MRKLMHLSCVLLGVAVGAGCSSSQVAVEAESQSIGAYEAGIGHLNTPGFALGDLVAMDRQTHKAWKVAAIGVDPMDVAFTQPGSRDSEAFSAPLELAYSKKIAPGMQSAGGSERAKPDGAARGELLDAQLKNPAAFAAGSAPLARAMARQHAQDPDARFFLVSAVSPADKVYLSYSGEKADTAKVGKYQFHIHYPQNSKLAKLAEQTPAFFRLTALKLEHESARPTVAVDQDFAEPLPGYQFKQSVASIW